MTRYLHKGRIALLAGLVSATVWGLAAVPSDAHVVCPPGTTNPSYCTHHITIKITVKINFKTFPPTVTIIVKVTDPHVKVTLWYRGKQIRTIFNGNYSGTKGFKIVMPKKPGVYTIKVKATAFGTTKTDSQKFTIKAHKQNSKKFALPGKSTKTFDVGFPFALKFKNAKYSCAATVSGPGKRNVRILSEGPALGGSVCRVKARNTGSKAASVRVTATTVH